MIFFLYKELLLFSYWMTDILALIHHSSSSTMTQSKIIQMRCQKCVQAGCGDREKGRCIDACKGVKCLAYMQHCWKCSKLFCESCLERIIPRHSIPWVADGLSDWEDNDLDVLTSAIDLYCMTCPDCRRKERKGKHHELTTPTHHTHTQRNKIKAF